MFLCISGILGKTGKYVYYYAKNSKEFTVNIGIDKNIKVLHEKVYVANSFKGLSPKSNIIIDFSSPEITEDLLNYAITKKIPLVIGTTGQAKEDLLKIYEASKFIPIMLCFSPNTTKTIKENKQREFSFNYEKIDNKTAAKISLECAKFIAFKAPKLYTIFDLLKHRNRKPIKNIEENKCIL